MWVLLSEPIFYAVELGKNLSLSNDIYHALPYQKMKQKILRKTEPERTLGKCLFHSKKNTLSYINWSC